MKIKRSSYFLMFMVLLGLFGIISSLTFQYIEAITLPLAMSSVIFVLSAIELTRELRSEYKAKAGIEKEPQLAKAEARVGWHRFGSALSWMIGFFVGIQLFGFLIATPLFVLSYVKRQGHGWLVAIGFAIGTVAFIYGVFELGLEAPLFKGLIFGRR